VVGIAVGESGHLRKRTAQAIHQIVTNVFAPFFFASIGCERICLEFSLGLTATVIGVACVGKLLGAGWARAWAGWTRHRRWRWAGHECARRHGNYSGDPGAAGGIDPREHVRRDGDYGLVHFADVGAGHSLLIHRRRKLTLRDTVEAKLFLPNLTRRRALERCGRCVKWRRRL